MAETTSFAKCSNLPVLSTCGFRFWDRVTDTQVVDDLEVDAIVSSYRKVIRAFRTLSGAFSFRGLPGLHDAEYPQNEERSASVDARFVVKVRDRRGHFLPCAFLFEGKLPCDPSPGYAAANPGLFHPGSPADLPAVYLFSAPARPVPPGFAVVRARVIDASSGNGASDRKPARHAVVRVEVKERVWHGIADERGEVVVPFPYPARDQSVTPLSPPEGPFSSSPQMPPSPWMPSPALAAVSPPQPAQARESWEVSVSVLYSPATVRWLSVGYPDRPESSMSDLASLLQQRPALIRTELSPPAAALSPSAAHAELRCTLLSGKELLLTSGGGSELLLDAVQTSP